MELVPVQAAIHIHIMVRFMEAVCTIEAIHDIMDITMGAGEVITVMDIMVVDMPVETGVVIMADMEAMAIDNLFLHENNKIKRAAVLSCRSFYFIYNSI
jgi:hypothetical protein